MSSKPIRPRPALAAFCLGAAALAAALAFKPYPALEGKDLLRSDDKVRVEAEASGLAFLPAADPGADMARKRSGLVFYGAARVPPEAYAYLARACALAGYTAILASMPLNFPLLAPSKASLAAAAHPEVTRWVIAGHSLGGAIAAAYVARPAAAQTARGAATSVVGLLLLAASPGRGVDLSTKSLPVVTVSASRDALESPESIAAAQGRLPAGSRYVEIAGGNHAQFGEYGPQPGDGSAEIPGPAQRQAAVDEALALLGSAEAGAGK
jgi:hypothetical protein